MYILNIKIQYTKTIENGNNKNPLVGAKRRVLYESKNKPLGKTKPSVLQSLDTMEATTIRQDVTRH